MAIGANLTKREQTMVGVAVMAVLVAAAYWYFLYSPRNSELTALDERVTALEKANQRARTDIQQGSLQRLQDDAARDARTLEIMQRLVPTSNEVPSLLEDISTSARRVGLDLASVEPMPVVTGDDFDTYRYKLSVIGDYHAIGELLTNVGSLGRIVAPVSLEIKPMPPAAQQQQAERQRTRPNPERPRLTLTFQIQTYVSRALAGSVATGASGREGGA